MLLIDLNRIALQISLQILLEIKDQYLNYIIIQHTKNSYLNINKIKSFDEKVLLNIYFLS